MTDQFNTWQSIQGEVLRRIHARDWPPGHPLPNEVELAAQFGCARATVNRALRALAQDGILERRRKAGTRVALHPISRATLDIPIIRAEVEDQGMAHGYTLLSRDTGMHETFGKALHITALHSADGAPFALEDRWISLATVPQATDQPFEHHSANEWLLSHVPYTHGDIAFSAQPATAQEARHLQSPPGTPLFITDRTTWDHDRPVTAVRLSYAPGYSIRTTIGELP
jgi:GntR family histidine utilization transcriptional repressor